MKIFRIKKFGLIAIIAVIIFYSFDQKLDPEFNEFFDSRKTLPEKNNAAFAITGMNAPLGTKNTYEWGKNWHQKSEAQFNERFKSAYYKAPTNDKINSDQLFFDDNVYETFNKISDDLNTKDQNKHKKSRLQLEQLGKHNKTVIKRYSDIYKYDDLQASELLAQNAIDSQRYILTDAVFKAIDGNTAEAFNIWHKDFTSTLNFVDDYHNWTIKSIVSAMIGNDLNYLNALIIHNPKIATQQYDKIKKIIKPLEIKDWNIKQTICAEYHAISSMFVGMENEILMKDTTEESLSATIRNKILHKIAAQPNASKNMFFKYSKEMLHLSSLKTPNAVTYSEEMQNNNFSPLDKNMFNKAGYMYMAMPGFTKYTSILIGLHQRNAQMRALNLLLDIKAQNIPREKAGEFIKNVSPEYYDPFTEKPFEWNEKKGKIFFACDEIKEGSDILKTKRCKEVPIYLN
ncbi:MAG: hypothetical protein GY804_02315 [Alphaproteobacteria bacterium]|nr:hypothetical protein [Alphaproteobacteria bacterium]